MSSSHLIFAVVGPSGCGKTTLINAALEALPDSLRVIKTYTTRSPRPNETDRQHVFISHSEAEKLRALNDLVESDEYAGHFYGTPKSYLNELLLTHHGIKAITESGVINMKNSGYPVRVIRIKPTNAPDTIDTSRAAADAKREEISIPSDSVIINDFASSGQEHAIAQLIRYLKKK